MAATDNFAAHEIGLVCPVENVFAVTPHDTNELAYATRGVYVGTAGDLKVTTVGGQSVTFTGLAAGIVHPLRVKLVFSTGTTAANILGLY